MMPTFSHCRGCFASHLEEAQQSNFPSALILPICLQVDSVHIQVLSGDQELEVLAEASGFVAESTEQPKEIAPN